MKLTFAFVVLACVLFEVAAATPVLPRAKAAPGYIDHPPVDELADLEAREPVLDWAYEKRSDTNEGFEKRDITPRGGAGGRYSSPYSVEDDELEGLQ